jgi:hypothetical protein
MFVQPVFVVMAVFASDFPINQQAGRERERELRDARRADD